MGENSCKRESFFDRKAKGLFVVGRVNRQRFALIVRLYKKLHFAQNIISHFCPCPSRPSLRTGAHAGVAIRFSCPRSAAVVELRRRKEVVVLADIEKLRKMINRFKINARSSNTCGTEPCSVDELKKAVYEAAKVMNAIVDEMESIDFERS